MYTVNEYPESIYVNFTRVSGLSPCDLAMPAGSLIGWILNLEYDTT